VRRLKILGEGGEVIYNGQGELRLRPDPLAQGTLGQISIYQEEVRLTEVRGRDIDITEFLRMLQVPYNVHYDAPEISLVWDPDPNPLSVPVPSPPDQVTLSIQYPAEALAWLGNTLRQSFEAEGERRARYESIRDWMRDIQPDITRLREAMESLARLPLLSGIQSALTQAAEAENQQAQQRAAGGHEICVRDYDAEQEVIRAHHGYGIAPRLTPGDLQRLSFGFDPSLIDEAEDSGSSFHEVLEIIPARSAEHETAITSARDAFPHDPLDYGRIYPGDVGTSRWTPPEDPDEKIRSCP
jgi:hypothetical protein